jgi:hypothetical protein
MKYRPPSCVHTCSSLIGFRSGASREYLPCLWESDAVGYVWTSEIGIEDAYDMARTTAFQAAKKT